MCLLRDVCFEDGVLTYYEDPALAAVVPASMTMATLAAEGLVKVGYLQAKFGMFGGTYSPRVLPQPRPPHLLYPHDGVAPSPLVHALGQLSYAQNWGHVLVDTLLPALGVAEVFGFKFSEIQLLNLDSCETFQVHEAAGKDRGAARKACKQNLERWVHPILNHPLLFPETFNNTCFRQLLVGHEASLSLAGMSAHRALGVRNLRSLLRAAHEEEGGEDPLLTHKILVLEKGTDRSSSNILLPNLCSRVRAWVARLSPLPPVSCVVPSTLSPTAQLHSLRDATLVVAENGSVGYLALLQRPGSSFLSLLSRHDTSGAKEVQVFLYLTDVQVFYNREQDMEEGGEGPGTLLIALERAGRRLGIPEVHLL